MKQIRNKIIHKKTKKKKLKDFGNVSPTVSESAELARTIIWVCRSGTKWTSGQRLWHFRRVGTPAHSVETPSTHTDHSAVIFGAVTRGCPNRTRNDRLSTILEHTTETFTRLLETSTRKSRTDSSESSTTELSNSPRTRIPELRKLFKFKDEMKNGLN